MSLAQHDLIIIWLRRTVAPRLICIILVSETPSLFVARSEIAKSQ